MDNKKFLAFMGVSALIFMLALGNVGCGGSSGGDVGTTTNPGEAH